MDKEIVVNRITRDLKLEGLIADDFTENVKFYIGLAWSCGWEQARREFAERTRKPVLQFTINRTFIQEYPSIEEAGKQMSVSRETVARAIKSGKPTRARHIWKYKERVELTTPNPS